MSVRPVDVPAACLERYRQAQGVLTFRFFEDAAGDMASLRAAIAQTLEDLGDVERDQLRFQHGRPSASKDFFGDWYDVERRRLVMRGSVTLDDGRRLENPDFAVADAVRSGGFPLPDPGAGGNFAYAFAWPPYGLKLPGAEIQSLFKAVVTVILPEWHEHEIRDWAHPQLPSLSEYFRDGMEWWGVFLFTIHTRALNRTTVIAGSATD